jgi:hypothetical protein
MGRILQEKPLTTWEYIAIVKDKSKAVAKVCVFRVANDASRKSLASGVTTGPASGPSRLLVADDHFAMARDDNIDAMTARWPNVRSHPAAEGSIAPADARDFFATRRHAHRDRERRTRVARIIDAKHHLNRRWRAAATTS